MVVVGVVVVVVVVVVVAVVVVVVVVVAVVVVVVVVVAVVDESKIRATNQSKHKTKPLPSIRPDTSTKHAGEPADCWHESLTRVLDIISYCIRVRGFVLFTVIALHCGRHVLLFPNVVGVEAVESELVFTGPL